VAPQNGIIPLCPDGSFGPIDSENCVNVCPPSDVPQPPGCVKQCTADKLPIGCTVICEAGSKTPTGCSEACCEKELCWDGSNAPTDPKSCVTLCPVDGNFNYDGCRYPCSRVDLPNSVLCIDVCTGSADDPNDCQEQCCPEGQEPSSVPTVLPTASPQQAIINDCEDGSGVLVPSDPDNCVFFCLDGDVTNGDTGFCYSGTKCDSTLSPPGCQEGVLFDLLNRGALIDCAFDYLISHLLFLIQNAVGFHQQLVMMEVLEQLILAVVKIVVIF